MQEKYRQEIQDKASDLKSQVIILKQQLEFKTFQLAEAKDRELHLKRLNETLMLALAEERPNIINEIKLITKQGKGPSQRERQLQKELQKLKLEREKEIEERVKKILAELQNRSCNRCKSIEQRNKYLEQHYKTLEQCNKYLEQRSKTQINTLETQRLRYQKNYQQKFQHAQYRIEEQWKKKLADIEISKNEQIEYYCQQIRQLQEINNNQINEYQEYYQNLIHERQLKFQETIQKLQNQPCRCKTKNNFEDFQRTSKISKDKNSRYPLEPIYDEQNQSYHFTSKPKQYNDKNDNIKYQIQNIISGLAKSKKASTSQATISQNNTTYIAEENEYSNFSIKDSLNRPNNLLLQSHLRLKKKDYNR